MGSWLAGQNQYAIFMDPDAAQLEIDGKGYVLASIGQTVGPADYTTWNAGVGYALTDHIGLDLRYWDTDKHSFGKLYKSRAVASIKLIW